MANQNHAIIKGGTAMRDDMDLGYFRQRLEQRLAEITGDQKPIAPLDLDPSRVGRLSRMDAMQQQAMAQAAARLSASEARRIRTALARMTSGDYGYCMHCEEEIAEERLRVDPSALTCIACARSMEAH
jgi:DnaK suppressor protein